MESPILANGRVALLDAISRYYFNETWDGKSTLQNMFEILRDDFKEPAKLTSPFLCQNCSRKKHKPKIEDIEKVYLQRSLF